MHRPKEQKTTVQRKGRCKQQGAGVGPAWADVQTKEWGLFVMADVVQRLVEQGAQLVTQDSHEQFSVLLVDQPVGEHSTRHSPQARAISVNVLVNVQTMLA